MAIQQQTTLPTRYVDRPELGETFADSIHAMVWDGQTLRIEFCVTRYPESPTEGGEAKRYPSCRLVLTATAVTDLFNRVQQTIGALVKTGVVSQRPPSGA
jgi:hypothetical protein